MLAAIASSRHASLVLARAVAPAADAPRVGARPQPPVPAQLACPVALAPAAMSALLEAQEGIAGAAPPFTQTLTVGKIDRLISTLADAPATAVDPLDAPPTVRQLETAREHLARATIDLRA